jgi:hypothetical protein
MFISGNDFYITNWFYKVELDPKQIFLDDIRVSLKFVGSSAIRPLAIFICVKRLIMLSMRVCVKSLTLDERWLEHMFISEDNYHLKNWFYSAE